jgi:glycine amidinotransferase
MSCVNSHNEWDSLQEVIVGQGVPSTLPALEFTFKLFFHDNIYNKPGFADEYDYTMNGYITSRHVEEHIEDVERFVEELEKLNIVVKRPKQPTRLQKVKTPNWESGVHPALNCRDL